MLIVQLSVAFLVAWFYYMVAMVMTVYDGPLSLLFQPIIGAILASAAVLVCFILGLPIRLVDQWQQAWRRIRWLPFCIGAIAFMLMWLSWLSPFRQTVYDDTLGMDAETFQPALALSGWLLSVFAALHCWFPLPRLRRRGCAQA